jgi:hypothetical protein
MSESPSGRGRALSFHWSRMRSSSSFPSSDAVNLSTTSSNFAVACVRVLNHYQCFQLFTKQYATTHQRAIISTPSGSNGTHFIGAPARRGRALGSQFQSMCGAHSLKRPFIYSSGGEPELSRSAYSIHPIGVLHRILFVPSDGQFQL